MITILQTLREVEQNRGLEFCDFYMQKCGEGPDFLMDRRDKIH